MSMPSKTPVKVRVGTGTNIKKKLISGTLYSKEEWEQKEKEEWENAEVE